MMSMIANKLLVFCYEPSSIESLDFLYTLIKRLNFQSYPVLELHLYDKEMAVRQIAAEFTNRVSSEIKGNIAHPSKVVIKCLDIFDGLQNVPDRIIHFGEAQS